MTSNFKRHLQRSSLLALATVAFMGCAPAQRPNTRADRVENVDPYRAGASLPNTTREIANNETNMLGQNLATRVPNVTGQGVTGVGQGATGIGQGVTGAGQGAAGMGQGVTGAGQRAGDMRQGGNLAGQGANLTRQETNITPYIPGENVNNMLGNPGNRAAGNAGNITNNIAGNTPRGAVGNNLNIAGRRGIGAEDVGTRQNIIGPSIAGKGYIANNVAGTEDLNARAQSLANTVVRIDEIDRASVIIVGRDTALVGINARAGLNEEQTRNLNSRIRQQVMDTDNRVQYVTVTTSPELVNRINTLSTRIRANNTNANFANEIREMIRTITPTV